MSRKSSTDCTAFEKHVYNVANELHINGLNGIHGNELELIALYRSCPILYSRTHHDRKNIPARRATWQAIANVIHSTEEECNIRVKSWRDRYAKERKGGTESKWPLFDEFRFLDDHIRHRMSFKIDAYHPYANEDSLLKYRSIEPKADKLKEERIGLPHNFLQQECRTGDSSESGAQSPPSNVLFVDSTFVEQSDVLTGGDTLRTDTSSSGNVPSTKDKCDEDTLFGQSIAAELRRIASRKKKMLIKANIYKILSEAESEDSS